MYCKGSGNQAVAGCAFKGTGRLLLLSRKCGMVLVLGELALCSLCPHTSHNLLKWFLLMPCRLLHSLLSIEGHRHR